MMVTKSLLTIVAGSLMALVFFPVYAGASKSVGWDSQSGCASGTTATSVETGTLQFRTAIDITLGKVEILREQCPDVHLTIKKSIECDPNVPPGC
jgi:hypothetical protein